MRGAFFCLLVAPVPSGRPGVGTPVVARPPSDDAVPAGGRTPGEFAVEIDSYRPFFITGQVAAPGQYPYVPDMSVESAIATAGGFTPRARRDRETLAHTNGSGSLCFVASLDTALSAGDAIQVGERWF